jgi:octaprenyl-diphosphate synthase
LHRNIKEPEKARRHLQQVQKLWGSEAGILLGDYLLSISFQILVKVGNLDVLECVSLATQNIARGQVLEVSEPPLTATPKHWRSVTRDKIAGLFGAGAQSAAYWGKSSEATASTLFDFGMHVGMAVQLKTELAAVEDEKLFQQKLKKQDLWSPLCFLLHDCMPPNESRELSDKLLNEFDVPEMFTKLGYLFKKYEVSEKVHSEAEVELREAKECLERLELDSAPLQPLTQYSMI